MDIREYKSSLKEFPWCFLANVADLSQREFRRSRNMCNVHFMRAVLKNIPKKDKKEIAYMWKEAFEDESKMQKVAVVLDEKGYSKSAETIERFRFDLWNYKAFSRTHWKRIRTTNRLERINKELNAEAEWQERSPMINRS